MHRIVGYHRWRARQCWLQNTHSKNNWFFKNNRIVLSLIWYILRRLSWYWADASSRLFQPVSTFLPFQPASVHCSSHYELKKLQNWFEGTLMVSHVTGLFCVMLITPPASSSRTGLTFTSRSCNYKAHICRWTLITLAIHSSCSDSSLQRRGSCAGPEETGRWRYLVNYHPLLIMP